MKADKRKLCELTRCYCVAPLTYQGKRHYLVASEKQFPCYLFDENGEKVSEVWQQPGGVMSMVEFPGCDGVFLATHRFYSPNDSKQASIVLAEPDGKGNWDITTLVDLPHVHRFDLLEQDGILWLIACTLCSGRDFKDDWSYPGKVYVCKIPHDLQQLKRQLPLNLTELKSGMLKNHGYFRHTVPSGVSGIVTCEEGVFEFYPPKQGSGDWTVKKLIGQPTSDALLLDFDGDGEEELLTFTPFHGDTLTVFHRGKDGYDKVFEWDQPIEFAHAICAGIICGIPTAVIGHRKGQRDLLAVRYNRDQNTYQLEVLDHDVGPANVLHTVVQGKDVLIAANREVNEIAYYQLS